MQVREVMNPGAVTVEPDSPASLAARLLSRNNIGALPVKEEDGTLVGVVTDRDIVLRCVAARSNPERTPVRDIMSGSPAVISPEADCRSAAKLMARQQVRRLPVVDRGRLVGMLSLGDLARCGLFDMEAAQTLCDISENIIKR